MNFLHKELEAGPDDVVEVALDGQANVMMLDTANYENYRRGDGFTYYGGRATSSPMRLTLPRQDRWHLVVDLGGYPGKVRAEVRVLENVEF